MPTYILRPASEADYEFLQALHGRTIKPYVVATWGWDDADQARRFRENFDPLHEQIVVVDGQDTGVLARELSAERLFLANLAIEPTHQGRGLGTEILRNLLAEAAAARVPVELQVLKVNPARRLYERLGFTVFAETTTHYRMRADPALDR